MPLRLSPQEVQKHVHKGFERMKKMRRARLMFLKEYVGPYYNNDQGKIEQEPLNLIFNAIRTLVPHIVMNFPKHRVYTQFAPAQEYAEMLQLALDFYAKKTNLKFVYRRAITDALFTLGIVKTGLAESESVYAIRDYDEIDTGEIFTEAVDFDNFVADADSRDHLFRDARYLGDKIIVPRINLLESGLYDNALVERLPSVADEMADDKAENLSRPNTLDGDYSLEDEVEIIELWIPSANALVTVPATDKVTYEDYLRVDDYYGPNSGPYSFLALTPPVPNNPIPVPPVGIWYDLHRLANKMARKTINQALRQKDVFIYTPDSADDMESIRDAEDGEGIRVSQIDAIDTLSLGGQRQTNEIMTAQLQSWFNMMAANPQGIGGQNLDADSATEAQILQQNANIGLKDMTDMVYQFAGEVAGKQAWYLHTDPFIQLPLIRRKQQPARYSVSPATGQPILIAPPEDKEEQIVLTPEARNGDWLDFMFEIQAESMGKMDSRQRLAIALDFATRVMPAVMSAAQVAAMIGEPFNPRAFITMLARDAGIDWLDHVFNDPNFHAKYLRMMQAGPSPENSKGQTAGSGAPGLGAILQNGQPGQVQAPQPSENTQFNQNAQAGAAESQSQSRLMGGPMV